MEHKFYQEYLNLAPIDKLREIATCYGIQDVKKYKSTNTEDPNYSRVKLIEKIIRTQKEKRHACNDHYVSLCKGCNERNIDDKIIEHYEKIHESRKGKGKKEIKITKNDNGKYKCKCKNTELDDTVEVYKHMYKNHNLIKMEPVKNKNVKKNREHREILMLLRVFV